MHHLIILLAFLSTLVAPPKVSAFFTADPQYEVAHFTTRLGYPEYVQNGQFTENLDHWGYSQDVVHATSDRFGHKVILSAQNGNTESSFLTQLLTLPETGKHYLQFWFRTTTTESLPGFDEPLLLVTANQQVIYSTNSSSADWQQVVMPLLNSAALELTFITQNTGDTQHSPQIELAAVSSAVDFQGAVTVGDFSEISTIHHQDNTYLEFLTNTSQYPITSYQLKHGSNLMPIILTHKAAALPTLVPAWPGSQEVLKVPQPLPIGTYQLEGVSVGGRVVAVRSFEIE